MNDDRQTQLIKKIWARRVDTGFTASEANIQLYLGVIPQSDLSYNWSYLLMDDLTAASLNIYKHSTKQL